MPDLTKEQHDYLLAACALAEGSRHQVDYVEDQVQERTGVTISKEGAIQKVLDEEEGLIDTGGFSRILGVTTSFWVTTAGLRYCERYGDG